MASCSGEDDNPSIETSNFMGTWNLEEMNYSGTSTVNFGGTELATSYSGEAIETDVQLVFGNGNTWESGGSYTIKLTTNFDGITDVQNVPVPEFSGSGTYSVNGNTLTTTQEGFNSPGSFEMLPMQFNEATISELTATRMVLTFDYTETATVEGMEVEVTLEGFQILTK